MRVLIQKTNKASVSVKNKKISSITNGLVVFVGFTVDDTKDKISWMAKKIVNLRIFEDDANIMNRSLLDVSGSILSVSQFTLYADTSNGNRPSYKKSLEKEKAIILYKIFNEELRKYTKVEEVIFHEDMEVSINNVGPTTICLER